VRVAVPGLQGSNMIKKFLMAISVLLAIVAVVYLSSRSRFAAASFETVISLVYLILIGGGSIYKLLQWWHYRKDPAKRESIAFALRTVPARWRQFYMDEGNDKAKKR
jgi:ABC-type nickel/cobalt efflux system permease component RcnA